MKGPGLLSWIGLLALALPLAAGAQQLTVSAAASLSDAFKEIGTQFSATRPNAQLRFNFGASGTVLLQIAQGAPADVFVSADAETMDRAVALRAVDVATRRDVAANTVVLVLPADAPARTLAQLAQADVRRVAIGKTATVPAGRYAKQALEAAGLWAQIEPKTVPADNVRQVLDYVARGEVDAGFVYRTDAATMPGRVRIATTLTGHSPVHYPAAVVADSPQRALALEFVAFLGMPAAQDTLARFGFGAP